jgi:hypothetical protein
VKAAILARVSTTDHETENPLGQLREAAARRGLEVVEPPYVAETSAWKGAHRRDLERALTIARAGRYEVLLVWALDRLTPRGAARNAPGRRSLRRGQRAGREYPGELDGGGRRAARPPAGHEVETAKEPGRADFAETLSFLKRQPAVLLPHSRSTEKFLHGIRVLMTKN